MRHRWYWLLFALYIAMEVAGVVDVPQWPWLATASKFSAVPMAVLLFFLVEGAASSGEELRARVDAAEEAGRGLSAQLKEVNLLRSDAAQLRKDIEAIRQKLRVDDSLLQGKLLFFQNKYEDAAQAFEDIVREQGDVASHKYWLGLALLRARRPRDAHPHLMAAADAENNPDYLLALGETEFRLRLPEAAEQHLKRAVAAGVRNQETAKTLLAKVQAQIDPEAAKVTLRAMIAENPYNGNTIQLLAEILIQEGAYADAAAACDKALLLNPRNWVLYPVRAEALLLEGTADGRERALDDLRKARSGNPRDYNIYRIEGGDLTKRALATPNSDERRKLLQDSLAVYEGGLKVIPGPSQAALHAAKAFLLLVLGEHEKAEIAARAAADLFPDHVNNHLMLCYVLFAARRWAPIRRAAQKARDVGGRFGRIQADIMDVLSGLAIGESVPELSEVLTRIQADIRQSPAFKAERREWRYCKDAVDLAAIVSPGPPRDLSNLLSEYLDGAIDNPAVVEGLGRFVA